MRNDDVEQYGLGFAGATGQAPPVQPPVTLGLAEAHMACRDNLAFLAGLQDESMQLIVTSPPYNIGKSYERRGSLAAYLERQRETIAECARLLAPRGSICWQVGNHVNNGEVVPLDIFLYDVFKSHGLKLRNRIVWHFEHGLHCSKRLSGCHETILWFTKGDDYVFDLDPIRVPSKYPGKKHFKGPKKGQLSGNPRGKNPGVNPRNESLKKGTGLYKESPCPREWPEASAGHSS